MKTIGLLGGMSWESTVFYYQTINRIVGERLEGLHSAKILLYSVDFHDIDTCSMRIAGKDPVSSSRMMHKLSSPVALSSSCSAQIPCTGWPLRSSPAFRYPSS